MKLLNQFKRYIYGLAVLLLSSFSGYGQNLSLDTLKNIALSNPTSLQFGPDGKLYVVQQNGALKIITIMYVGNQYKATQTETVNLIRQIPNHWDHDGSAKPYNINTNKRQVTGVLVAGTASAPVVYIASSDPEIGAGSYGDKDLCTNSGILSKLYLDNGVWKKIDLVRGFPRSEENHAPNGMQIYNNKLYLTIGGFTNSGGVSTAWTYITEYALSACILEIDLTAVEAMTTKADITGSHPYKYDLPTLDDPTRPNKPDGTDINDPWGGNDGLNQAMLQSGTPVRIYASGLRNPYDIVITKTAGRQNRMYTVDNAPNRNWGGWPKLSGGLATNDYDPNEPGTTTVVNNDGLKFIGNVTTYNPTTSLFYGGHPNPIRANPAGAGLYSDDGTHRGWRNDNSDPDLPLPSNWPPVKIPGNPIESNYYPAGTANSKSLLCFDESTNGICEYTASGVMQGDLLAVDYGGNLHRIKLDNSGNVINNKNSSTLLTTDAPLAKGFGNSPLDVTAQGDGDIFPGTIWVAVWGSSTIVVFKPVAAPCAGTDNASLDEDNDKYDNADEIDNGTNPCSASSKPSDNDKDYISDLNDPDDDNDGISDILDCFPIDENNGVTTTLPTHYNLFNFDPGIGFFGLGFTGLMMNGTTDYLNAFDTDNLIAGGAAGAFTVDIVDGGDALGSLNTQKNAFQFGVKVAGEGPFVVQSALLPNYFNQAPQDFQSQGIYIGTGDQNNYLKLALCANGGIGGMEVTYEANGVVEHQNTYALQHGMPTGPVKLYIIVDPSNKRAFLKYCIGSGDTISLGSPITMKGNILNAFTDPSESLAMGIIATSRSASTYSATWDYMEAFQTTITSINQWKDGSLSNKIHIFPNPGKDKIKIQVETDAQKTYAVQIYNNMGILLKEEDMTWTNFSENDLNISGLKPGVYQIQFIDETDARTATTKFVKE